MSPTATPISFTGLDPVLAQLGEMIGLLSVDPNDPNTTCLNAAWFGNPLASAAQGIKEDPAAFASLLGSLLGSVTGHALGVPAKDPGLLGSWYPIPNPSTGEPMGLYLVTQPPPGASDASTELVFGLGVLHRWTIGDTSDPGVFVDAYGLIPLLELGSAAVKAVLGTSGYPVTVGLAASGAGSDAAAPLVQAGGFSFDGVKVSATLDVSDGSNPLELSLVVLSLELPGDAAPTDRSLSDLASISGQQIIETAASLLVTALCDRLGAGANAAPQYLLPLLGLAGELPGATGAAAIPPLRWDTLLERARENDAAGPFRDWFMALASDPPALSSWLAAVAGFLGNPKASVSGSGTRPDPLTVMLLADAKIGTLSFTAATSVAASGARSFFPGLTFEAAPQQLGSAATLSVTAALELAEFVLSGAGLSAIPTSLGFDVAVTLANSKPGTPLVSSNGYGCSTLRAGVALGSSGGSLRVVPTFELGAATIPSNPSLGDVNLLSPASLANAGAQALADAVTTAIDQLFALAGNGVAARSTAALLGFVPPIDQGWPASLTPPLSGSKLLESLADPIGALGAYYRAIANTPAAAGAPAPLSAMLSAAARLLSTASTSVTVDVTGTGTAVDPWLASLHAGDDSLPAQLVAWTVPGPAASNGSASNGAAASVAAICFGLSIAPKLTLGSTTVAPSVLLRLLDLELDASGAGGVWLPGVNAEVALPNGFSSPAVGGTSFAVSSASISAGWSRAAGWSWSVAAGAPTLTLGSSPPLTLGSDLDFQDQSGLAALVTTASATFAPFFTGLLGAQLVNVGGRPGLAAAGLLGLLPDISEVPTFPAGATWPTLPPLDLTSLFTDPRGALRARLAALLADAKTASEVLSVLSWALSPALTSAPRISGELTFEAPLTIPVGTGAFDVLVWYDATGSILGIGLGRTDAPSFGSTLVVTRSTRLNAIEISLGTGRVQTDSQTPSASFVATVAAPGGLLVPPANGVQLGSVDLGVQLAYSASALKLTPVLNLRDAQLGTGQLSQLLTVDDLPTRGGDFEQAFLALTNAGISRAVSRLSGNAAFEQVYALLVALGLGNPRAEDSAPYGINPGGWSGLFADPTGFASSAFSELLADTRLRTELFALVQRVLGVTVPEPPAPVLALLEALGIVGPESLGHPILPGAVIELVNAPFATLAGRAQTLLESNDARATLLGALTGDAEVAFPSNSPLFQMQLAASHIRVETAPGAWVLGGVVDLGASIDLDVANAGLAVSASVNVLPLGARLVPTFEVDLSRSPIAPVFGVELAWGGPELPALPPLTVFPFDGATFVAQVEQIVPVFALDVLVGAALNSELVARYPLARILMQGLGLVEGPANGPWRVRPLGGLLHDPLGWLLSDSVLGDSGQLGISSVGKILQALAAARPQGWTSSNGISAVATSTELTISGLPYSLQLSLAVSAAQVSLGASTTNLEIAGGGAVLQNLAAAITLDAAYQPGLTGEVVLGATGSTPWFVRAAYDQDFELGIGQGSAATPTGLQLDLLPFMGWGALADRAVRTLAPMLLQQIVPRLLDGLQSSPDTRAFAEKLSAAGAALDASSLVTQLSAVTPFTAEQLEITALDWLLSRFDATHRDATAQAIVTLLSDVMPAGALRAQGGLLRYQPGASVPFGVSIGVNSDNLLGLWATLAVPDALPLKVELAPTGIGIPLSGPTSPVFSFGVTLTIPVDGSVGPQASLAWAGTELQLAIDPLGDASQTQTESKLYRELFPSFFPSTAGQSDAVGDRVTSWIIDVITQVLPRYVSIALFAQPRIRTWLDQSVFGEQGPSAAEVLVATQLIRANGTAPNVTYALNSLDALLAITGPAFVANLIRALLGKPLTLLTFDSGKGTLVVGPSPTNASALGVRLAVSDFALPELPQVVFQLGAKDKNWLLRSGATLNGLGDAPGLSVYVPVTGTGTAAAPQFSATELNLVNVGMDFVGKATAPLVALQRFQLGSVKPRGLLAMSFEGGFNVSAFGAAASLDDMMLSLTPSTLTAGAGGNPIAQNLLGSGTSASESNPAPNPSFSFSVGYVKGFTGGGQLSVLLSGSAAGDNAVVVPVQRAFGPLYIGSIGLGWDQADYLLDVLFTGSIALAGLEVDLVGLSVGVPVTDPTNFSRYQLELQGLDVSFKGGPVSITGGLLKTTDPQLMYTGTALIKAASFSVVGAGSYTEMVTGEQDPATAPSLFIFAALKTPLGGVPAFFVTAVAAGFGYNRTITLPSVGEVQNFPLVAGVKSGSFTEGQSPDSALAVLNEVIAPAVGQYWIAAGLEFTTYEILDTLAILFVRFGRDFEIDLIGLSSAALPPEIPRDQALAYIELGLKVSFNPSVGFVSAEAQLTPNSYVITKDCKLTGGFAFYLWFKDQVATDGTPISAGDFVLSLGGYHPAFKVPSYYPVVPRLGFSWLFSMGGGSVAITGGAYFALVPTAIMAGGNLNVAFTLGPLKAWLLAAADFLIEWRPFFFDVSIKVSVGVSFHTSIAGVSVTLSAELGADLELTGPPTHGQAHVSWYVISFTIPIGSGDSATTDNALTWEAFSQQLLPSPAATPAPPASSLAVATDPDPRPGQQVVKIAPTSGLLEGPGARAPDAGPWMVRPVPFGLSVSSAIPVSLLSVTGFADVPGSSQAGVRPMGKTTPLNAPLSIQVLDKDGNAVDLAARNLVSAPVYSGGPGALWSRSPLDPGHAPDPTTMVVSALLMSVRLEASRYLEIGTLTAFPLQNLKYDEEKGVLPYSTGPRYSPSAPYSAADQANALARLQASVMAPRVVIVRNEILQALRSAGLTAPSDPDLSVTATSAGSVVQAPPVLARIGAYQTGATVVPATPPTLTSTPPAAPATLIQRRLPMSSGSAVPELLAIRRSYAAPAGAGAAPAEAEVRRAWIDRRHRKPRAHISDAGAAARAADAGAAPPVQVFAGTLLLWKLPRQRRLSLDHRGDLSLRAICLDEYGDPISDQFLGAGTHDVPDGTHTLSVEGHGPEDASGVAGWSAESVLTRLSPNVAVGRHVIVSTQNGGRVRQRGRRLERGLLRARTLSDQNLVHGDGGQLTAGWVKTAFAVPIRSFAVTLSGGDAARTADARVRVSVKQGASPRELAPAAVRFVSEHAAAAGATLLVYALDASAPYSEVVVQPSFSDGRVLGVVGGDAAPSSVRPGAGGARLNTAALRPLDATTRQSQVVLRSSP